MRRRQGTYAFNYDLHNVIGVAAIPFLVMWGFTGAHFELKQVSELWYAVLPGEAREERDDRVQADPGPLGDHGRGRRDRAPDGAGRPARVGLGARRGDEDSTYFAYLARGNDPYDHGVYPGNVGVTIDRYSGEATVTYPSQADPPLSAQIVDDWFYPLHAGTFIERLVADHLARARPHARRCSPSPASSTWLIRRGKRRRKRRRAAAAAGMSESLARHGRALRRRADACSRWSPPRAAAASDARTPPRPSCSGRARRSTR